MNERCGPALRPAARLPAARPEGAGLARTRWIRNTVGVESQKKSQLTARGEQAASRKLIPQADGSTAVAIHIDLAQLPAPERSYVADQVGVKIGQDVRLLFVQTDVAGGTPRSLVCVSLFPEAVRQFLGACDTFLPALEGLLDRNGRPGYGPLTSLEVEPPHVVLLRANMIVAGYSGRAAEFQFFHLAPYAIHKVRASRGGAPQIDPVVRIDLSTWMLYGTIKALKDADLPEDWK